jgi:hypothetical protein
VSALVRARLDGADELVEGEHHPDHVGAHEQPERRGDPHPAPEPREQVVRGEVGLEARRQLVELPERQIGTVVVEQDARVGEMLRHVLSREGGERPEHTHVGDGERPEDERVGEVLAGGGVGRPRLTSGRGGRRTAPDGGAVVFHAGGVHVRYSWKQ